ncbi:MAG: rhomboid family intramembrane serine protease [Minicystis sp.]
MRSPPHPARLPAYPITGGVGLLAILVTILVAAGKWDLARFQVTSAAFGREPWRLLLSALPHAFDVRRADFFHLPFNILWLWTFGTLIEDVFGHVKTLLLFALLAAGSAIAEYALFRGGIGLSGVTYGLFGALWFLAPRDRRFAGGVDARTTRIMVGWFFFCIVCTTLKVWEVANVAHAVGALLGVLVGAGIAARTRGKRFLATAAIPLVIVASSRGATTLRPKVNLAHDAHDSFMLGLQALQTGRFEDAIRHYRIAVATDPQSTAAWYNLGIAYGSTNRGDEAVDAYRHAYDLDPHDTRHRSAYAGACRYVGATAFQASDHAKAVRLLTAAIDVEPADGVAWYYLGKAYAAQGKNAEADAARERAIQLAPQNHAP